MAMLACVFKLAFLAYKCLHRHSYQLTPPDCRLTLVIIFDQWCFRYWLFIIFVFPWLYQQSTRQLGILTTSLQPNDCRDRVPHIDVILGTYESHTLFILISICCSIFTYCRIQIISLSVPMVWWQDRYQSPTASARLRAEPSAFHFMFVKNFNHLIAWLIVNLHSFKENTLYV